MTILTIAHRLSTIKNADSILFIDEGKILASKNLERMLNL